MLLLMLLKGSCLKILLMVMMFLMMLVMSLFWVSFVDLVRVMDVIRVFLGGGWWDVWERCWIV